ncbi:hypothetical protein [Caulobacter sp.]|uniref:hypothetical protein n=1 Tax=Caulobacter sp. TaxID=78 RepID=UPI003BAB76DB
MTSGDLESALGKFRSDAAAEVLRQAIRNLETKFDPNQPRAPVGSSNGGQWVDTGRGGGGASVRKLPRVSPKPTKQLLPQAVRTVIRHPAAVPATLRAAGLPALAGGVAISRQVGEFDRITTGRAKTPFLKLPAPELSLTVTDVTGGAKKKRRTKKWRPGVGRTSVPIEDDCDELYINDEIKCASYAAMYGKDKAHKGAIYGECMSSAMRRHAICLRDGIDAVNIPLFDGRRIK